MDNPFRKRATEYLRDDEAFLAIVSPEPVTFFLGDSGEAGRLYDRLVLLRGTPGSGKSTLARLFEYPTLATLLKNTSLSVFQALTAALVRCGAIREGLPSTLGCRLLIESDYRDFWEFPYPDGLKLGLVTALIQARAVLGWLRHLSSDGVDHARVEFVPRADAESVVDSIGGTGGAGVHARAREVEAALYRVMKALVAPAESEIHAAATGAYRPFDIIESIRVHPGPGEAGATLELRPLAILDDAHELHPEQFREVQRWLLRRELRIARWMIARFDILHPEEALAAVTEDRSGAMDYPGLSAGRETETILLQSSRPRREQRTAFRRMAKDMAGRYLRRMSLFSGRQLKELGDLLQDREEPLGQAALRDLHADAAATQGRLQIADARREGIERELGNYQVGGRAVPEDVRLAMLIVLLHRYERRRRPPSLFEGDADDPEPSRPVAPNVSVYEAAKLHLLHKHQRPYFFGIDDLCDAASENAEQFLNLAAVLVEESATRIIRSKPATLDARTQHRLLRDAGRKIIEGWNFPHHQAVGRLVEALARRCIDVSLQPSGKLTPNAYGILQADFDSMPAALPELARVLQYGVAYNAITLVPHHSTKSQEWCLLELGGMVILRHGLTLKRGGFIEGSAAELARIARGG